MRSHSAIKNSVRLVVLLGACATIGSAAGDDWARWRGPNGLGISAETQWSAEDHGELWKTNVGLGYSCVTVSAGRLYTMGFHEDEKVDTILCLDAVTGEKIWSHSYPARKWQKSHGGGTNSTPVVAGDRLYVLNREGQFFCFDAKTGQLHWQMELRKEFDITLPSWGFAGAPTVIDDTIYLNLGRTIAFDFDGNSKWQSKNYGHAYSTPIEFTLKGKPVLAAFASDGLAILDRNSGEEITLFPWKTGYDVNASTPIPIGDKVFISSGYNHGCALVDLSSGTATAVWESKVMRNKVDTSVVIGGHVYGFDNGTLKCIDLEGKVRWDQRGLGQGALSAAGDRLLVMSARGELVVAEASPEGYTELSREKILGGGKYWTAPVIVDGLIYCRNSLGDLVCRDHRQGPARP